eukprot:CAMPEP_0174821904 /NCGR_PEP_ID=MMETSP1107-20130205/11116_1 /TAXON_ID=36770 /ORGANISM="Paraphysomonas vestita, Strain GFlagA" /LENGTH=448 /DNA_ID=CAMNT_0016039501 /DNA_START=180 /DNA_END=1526 /DNA_ORIENTATION=-
MAVSAGQVEVIKELVKFGSDINHQDEVDEVKYYLLDTAAQNNQIEAAKLLLEYGQDINYRSADENTPLIMAALYGQHEIIKFLIDNGADIHLKNDQGNTALIAATYKGHAKAVKVLLDAGSNPNEANIDGTTPIVLAARGDYPKVLRELIRAGANVNVLDGNDCSPLSIAARSSHIEMVNLLIAAGADLEVVDSTHHTALHHTYINNHRNTSRILSLAGASHGSVEGVHDGIAAAQIPKVPVCYWYRGLLKRFKFSQKQTSGKYIGRKACEYLSDEHQFRGSIVKLLDKIAFYGYRTTVDNLGFETFLPEGQSSKDNPILEELKATARNDLKSMHTKDYKEHFRQTDEDELEKNLPGILRKFGADIPLEKREDDLTLADIANEKVSRKEYHRAPKDERPQHFRDADTIPKAGPSSSTTTNSPKEKINIVEDDFDSKRKNTKWSHGAEL